MPRPGMLNPGTTTGTSILLAAALITFLSKSPLLASVHHDNPLIGLTEHENYMLYLSVAVLVGVTLFIVGAITTLTAIKSPYAKDAYAIRSQNYHDYAQAFETYHNRGECLSNIIGAE